MISWLPALKMSRERAAHRDVHLRIRTEDIARPLHGTVVAQRALHFANLRAAFGKGGVVHAWKNARPSRAMNPYVCRVLSTTCFFAGMISIIGSIAVWWFLDRDTPDAVAHAERFGIFIGLWAPTLLILSNRFDRYADKARPLPGLDVKLNVLPDEIPEEGY